MFEYLEYTKECPIGTVASGIFLGYIVWYSTCIVKRPVVACNPKLKRFLLTHCPVINRKYWPTFWCVEARVQTLVSALIKTSPIISYRKEFICTHDGGHVALDWMDNDKESTLSKQQRPTVVLLPGLTGSSDSSYVLHFVRQVAKLGCRAVVFNYRGLGGAELKTPRTYSATNTEDVTQVIDHVKQCYPEAPVMAAGISLGGLILSNYVAEMGVDCPLVAAMSVSAAWDVVKSVKTLEEPINSFIFNKYLTDGLISVFLKNAHWFTNVASEEDVKKCRTIRQFDDVFTAKQFGYPSYKEYYEDARLCKKVHDIKIPYLALNAADDMFSPEHTIPLEEANKSDNVAIVMTQYGGHIGFMEGLFPRHETYMDKVFSQFVDAIFTHSGELHRAD